MSINVGLEKQPRAPLSADARDIWTDEDFQSSPDKEAILDPWEPDTQAFVQTIFGSAAEIVALENSSVDFWDPVPSVATDNVEIDGDWTLSNSSLPDFQPRASQKPFEFVPSVPNAEKKANQRARWLVALLDIPQRHRHLAYVRRFVELFVEYPHARTFATLSGLALDDVSADDLLSAFELKDLWAMSPTWWSIRRKGSREPVIPTGGRTMLGWSAACKFISQRKGLPAETAIDFDWYDDWLELSFGDPLYWRFLDYAEARIDAFAAGELEPSVPPRRHMVVLQDDAVMSIVNNPSRTMLLIEPMLGIRNAAGHSSSPETP